MTVGSIIAGGFGLVRERPGAVAVWGLIYLAATIGLALALQPIFGPSSALMSGNPELAGADVGPMMGRLLLAEFLFFAVVIVLMAAAQRAVLQPERQGFAYLRLGMDELRLLGLSLLFLVIFYAGMIVAVIVMSLLVGLVAVAAGPAAAVPLVVIEVFALLALLLWLQVRLSLAFPLTLLRGRIIVGEAWRSTRSRFWTLFGAFLVIFLLLLVLWTAVSLVSSGSYFAELAQSGFTPEGMQAAAERQMARQFGGINATNVAGWLLGAIAGALSIALFGGAVATAARELTVDVEGLEQTFA